MHSSILKLVFTYNKILNVSVNHVGVIGDIKHKDYRSVLEVYNEITKMSEEM
jgi:hypothetical protein